MLPDLYLIRHGETEWNLAGRLQGVLDSPLTPCGRRQARALRPIFDAAFWKDTGAQRFSSPQGRATQTSSLIFQDHAFQTDHRLREIHLGRFSGQSVADLRRDHPQIHATPGLGWYDVLPGAERLADVMRRVKGFLSTLTGPAVVVTHGVTLRLVWLAALGQGLDHLDDEVVVQGAVHVIRNGCHTLWQPPSEARAPDR